ncbi:hypothetical protein GOODEAATRI_018151 [Goodea atripinnis]|uniref:Ubiquitin-like domain-containing protein n=1 Tax=Goodea atripinnis TaxID=208336 RepID=A0ABV0NBL5_9TELE
MTNRKEPPFFNDDSVGAFQYKLPFYDTMELFIETLTGTCFELRVLPFEAVVSVKAKIQRLEGIPVAQQHLIWNNVELDDDHCLHDYGLHYSKSAKVTPLAPADPHPGTSSLGPSSTQHLYRLVRSLPQINQPWQTNAPLPPIVDPKSTDPARPPAAATSSHVTVHRRCPPSFSSSSCYMLQEEEPWEACPSFAKIRSPPKVSRMDIGSRLMKDCVYPQLPPLCTRGTPESPFEPVEPSVEAVGLSILEEPVGLVVPAQPGASFGELSDPLSLDMSIQHEGGHQTIDVGAQHQLSHSPWTLGTSDTLTSRADGTQLGTSVHISPPCPLAASPSPSASTRLLSQPFDSTLCIQANLQAQSLAKPGNISPHPPASLSTHPARLRGVKVESPGKRPELISKREARGITKMVNQAYKEPLGSLSNSELFASLSTRAPDSSSIDNLGESLGFAQTLPPSATASAHSGLGSRLPSIPTKKFLQDDLFRPMSPLRRAAASYRVSSQNH